MSVRSVIVIQSVIMVLVLGACEKKLKQDLIGPLAFEVTFDNYDSGSPDNPLPYRRDVQEIRFSVQAIDMQGNEAIWFEGDVDVTVAPRGKLAMGQEKTVRLTAGRASDAVVAVERLHGKTTLWVEDKGTEYRRGSHAVGLSPDIYVDNPFLSDIQYTDSTGTSPLKGDFVEINLKDRQAIVTGITKDGFYLTDVTEPDDAFNAVYVYTHSLPKSVQLGTEIIQLNGTVQEYYGFTELGFPSYQVGAKASVPSALVITPEMLGDGLEMEKRESRLVAISQGTVCPLDVNFERYGQWAVNLEQGTKCSSSSSLINVVSSYTVEWFDPREHVGKTLKSITGNLRQHTSAKPMWIVYTRQNSDIVLE